MSETTGLTISIPLDKVVACINAVEVGCTEGWVDVDVLEACSVFCCFV